MGRVAVPAIERFMAKIVEDRKTGCWLWQGATNGAGYGKFRLNGDIVSCARWIYEHENGPISDGLILRHLCKITLCCNPSHLKIMTHEEAAAIDNRTRQKKDCCIRGHKLDGDNVYISPRGMRICMMCARIRAPRYRKGSKIEKKTHCRIGHPYSGDNLIILANGYRTCRECARTQERKYSQKRREQDKYVKANYRNARQNCE